MSVEALSMVLNHSRAIGSPKVILLGIANHLGPDADEGAWPSLSRLAAYANISERGVQKAVQKLVDLGELRVQVADGVSRNQYKPNRYWITIECPDDCDGSMWHRRGEPQYGQGRTTVPSGVNPSTNRDEPQFVLNSKETVENRYTNRFEDFWSAYPRREAKGQAFKAWKKAIKTHNQQMIIEAAKRYAESYTGEYQFIPLASSWLNAERWLDEPPPAARKAGPVTVMDLYADEPCEHGDPMGKARCALCRRK